MAVAEQQTTTKADIGAAVAYTLKVDNQPVSEALEMVSINIHQEINFITRATIVLIDSDPDTEHFTISSSNQFLPGKTIEISLGYADIKQVTSFKGIIVSNAQKADNECAMLTLECKDETVKMTIDKNSTHHDQPVSATDIADDFFSKYGITFTNKTITPSTLHHDQLVQFNSTDWDFMISKLDAANLMCILNNGDIIIKEIKPKPDDDTNLVQLEFGNNIIEFEGDLDARTQSEKVTVLTWNYTTQQVENEDKEPVPEANQTSVTKAFKKALKTTLLASGKKKPEEQQKAAENKLNRKLLAKIKGKVKFFGRTDDIILPGDFIKLVGLGDHISKAPVFVSAIDHEYSEGDWTTTATLGWTDKFYTEQINPSNEASANGELSSIQGLHTGVITGIVDDAGDFRVKLKMPLVDNNQDGVFARLATLDAGSKRGTFFMPEIGDEVVVGFMNNDPSQPVVLGSLYSSKHAPPLTPAKPNNQKGYVSRTEIKIIMDDDERSVTIETPGGHVFKMNDKEGKVTITDSNKNTITMEPAGITIDAAKVLKLKAGTSISVAAPKVELKADGAMTVQAGGTATVKSSGMMNIKGSMVNIN